MRTTGSARIAVPVNGSRCAAALRQPGHFASATCRATRGCDRGWLRFRRMVRRDRVSLRTMLIFSEIHAPSGLPVIKHPTTPVDLWLPQRGPRACRSALRVFVTMESANGSSPSVSPEAAFPGARSAQRLGHGWTELRYRWTGLSRAADIARGQACRFGQTSVSGGKPCLLHVGC